ALAQLDLGDVILDGEVVALAPDGTSDFQALHNMLRRGSESALVFFVFDLLYHRGYDLRQVSLLQRTQRLAQLPCPPMSQATIRYSDHISGPGSEVWSSACQHGLEGIISKRASSSYVSRRSADWVKVKCLQRQEFVVGGWTSPSGARVGLGA